MLSNSTRRSNFDLDREAAAARFANLDDQAQAQAVTEISDRTNQASAKIRERIVEGYGARNIELPASVWIAGSPVEAADMLQRRGVEVVLMPIGQSLTGLTGLISDELPAVDPDRGSSTSWSLNLKIEGHKRTSIIDAEPVFTKTVGGTGYRDAQNSQLISTPSR